MQVKVREAALKFRGWSIYKLAQQIDMPHQSVYAWAWGKTRPTYQNLAKICEVLGCSPNDLLQ